MSERENLVANSAWMALGTVVSRLTGFLRSALLIAALGVSLNADIFTGANTVPNALYILVAGGIFNIILVPQLVRAMRRDDDGGDAFAQRIITLGVCVLLIATLVLMVLVPVLMRITFDSDLFASGLEPARASAETLMLLCLPQVFFYGAFVLLGQILNARRRFGPMMWAPIANNVVSCAVLVLYIGLFGAANDADGFTRAEELLLGLGSTLGIAVQFAILVPILRATGFRFKARFDFRGVGLRKTAVMGLWAFGFIVINQIAYFAIQRIGTGATVEAAKDGVSGAGATVYQFAHLVSQVPHGVITVSVMTAAMPSLSAYAVDRDWLKMRTLMDDTTRLVLVIIVPLAFAVAILAGPLASVTVSYGGATGSEHLVANTIVAFAPAMAFSTFHYLMLRGFYSLEDARTPFFIQVVLAGLNIALAFWFSSLVAPANVAMVLALAYAISYGLGSVIAAYFLSRRIGPVIDGAMWAYLARMLVACLISAGVMGAVVLAAPHFLPAARMSDLIVLIVGGLAGAAVYLLAARALGLKEIALAVGVLRRRRRG